MSESAFKCEMDYYEFPIFRSQPLRLVASYLLLLLVVLPRLKLKVLLMT